MVKKLVTMAVISMVVYAPSTFTGSCYKRAGSYNSVRYNRFNSAVAQDNNAKEAFQDARINSHNLEAEASQAGLLANQAFRAEVVTANNRLDTANQVLEAAIANVEDAKITLQRAKIEASTPFTRTYQGAEGTNLDFNAGMSLE